MLRMTNICQLCTLYSYSRQIVILVGMVICSLNPNNIIFQLYPEGKVSTCADPEGEWDRGSGPSHVKYQQNIGFLSNTGPDP